MTLLSCIQAPDSPFELKHLSAQEILVFKSSVMYQ